MTEPVPATPTSEQVQTFLESIPDTGRTRAEAEAIAQAEQERMQREGS